MSSTTAFNTRRLLSTVALSVLGAGALFACASEGSSSEADAKEKSTSTTVSATEVVDTTTTVPAEDTSTDGGSTGGGQSDSPDAPAGPAPTITAFTTPENIDCHNGNFQEFTASWSTTNAAKVTISIDGPGIYAEYPANGETSLPFNCSTAHTFLLTAHSQDGQTATKSITLQPRNAQTDDTGDPEEDL